MIGRPSPALPAGAREGGLWLGGACAVWLALFAAYGSHGFNFRDDGYLLTLAERVLRGDVLYRDVSYLRPPVSVFLQAALLAAVPGYAVAASRWYLALEVTLILVAVFALLRRVEPAPSARAAYALLAVVYAFTGGFAPMPWHTVDGICLGALATWALAAAVERRSAGLLLAGGLAAGTATFAKQGFAVVALAGLGLTLTAAGRRIGPRGWAGALAYVGGVAVVPLLSLVYLARHGAVPAFVESVVWAPREITREVFERHAFDLLVGMHLPYWIGGVVGVGLLCLVALRLPPWARLGLAAIGLTWLGATLWVAEAGRRVQWHFVVQPVYTLSWLGGASLLAGRALGRVRLPTGAAWAIGLALSTLYASSWSFVGIRLALGHVVALPLVLLGIVGGMPAGAEAGAADRGPGSRRFAATCVLVYAALFMALLQIAVPSLETSRLAPTAAFATERLRGLRSSLHRVRGVDGVVDLVRRETAPSDYVLAFMDFPALYFLTERRNPTRVDWYLPEELPWVEVRRALLDLRHRPPRLVILASLYPSEMVRHARLRPVLGHILEHYEQGEAIGEFLVFRPRTPATR